MSDQDLRTRPAPVLDPRLGTAIRRIARLAPAEAIILFGSRARNTSRDDSDYDLCVVMPATINPAPDHAGRLRRSVSDIDLSIHVVTRRAKDLLANKHNVHSLAYDIAREGKLVFGGVPGLFEP